MKSAGTCMAIATGAQRVHCLAPSLSLVAVELAPSESIAWLNIPRSLELIGQGSLAALRRRRPAVISADVGRRTIHGR